LTESAEIGHNLAESTNLTNGFYRLLARSQHLAAEKTLSQMQDLSMKTQSEKQLERDILTASAILCRVSQQLWRVNCEALLIAAGQNLKRLLSQRGWGRRPLPSGAALHCSVFFGLMDFPPFPSHAISSTRPYSPN
jgi:hypothetical protein